MKCLRLMGYLKCLELLWIFNGSKTTTNYGYFNLIDLSINNDKSLQANNSKNQNYSIISKAFPECKI
jgi:hypothetical protein